MSDSAPTRYAEELKAWRALLHLTQKEFADRIGHSLALVAAVEQCVRAPSPTFAQACDAATGAPGTFARWQMQVVEESYPAFFAPVVEFERSAARLHSWDPARVRDCSRPMRTRGPSSARAARPPATTWWSARSRHGWDGRRSCPPRARRCCGAWSTRACCAT